MSATDLETILLPEEISANVSLHCLACRQRLGSVSYVDQPMDDGTTQIAVSVAVKPSLLRDFRQGRERVILVCTCRQRSTFHLL